MSTAEARSHFAARLDRYYRAHYGRLIRRWAGRAGGVSEAEDLLQEAFLGLYRAHAEGERLEDGDAALEAVLEVAIRNKHYDRLRRVLSRSKHEAEMPSTTDEDGNVEDAADLLGNIADEDVDVEHEVAVRDLCGRVLARLTPHWRSVIALLLADRGVADLDAIFGRDGYVLRRQARQQFCGALRHFIGADSMARWLGRHACGWPA